MPYTRQAKDDNDGSAISTALPRYSFNPQPRRLEGAFVIFPLPRPMQLQAEIVLLPSNVCLLLLEEVDLALLLLPLAAHLCRLHDVIRRHQLRHLPYTLHDIVPAICEVVELCLKRGDEVLRPNLGRGFRERLVGRALRSDAARHADQYGRGGGGFA